MFERASLRIVAGMMLWSIGFVLVGVAYHNRTYALIPGKTDVWQVTRLLECMLGGAFFGAFLSPFVCTPPKPNLPNIVAASATLLGLILFSIVRVEGFLFPDDPIRNGYILLLILVFVAGVLGSGYHLSSLRREQERKKPDHP